eukprot:scaffold35935_cov81-Phaeocystis_antarctica.AAC.2
MTFTFTAAGAQTKDISAGVRNMDIEAGDNLDPVHAEFEAAHLAFEMQQRRTEEREARDAEGGTASGEARRRDI